MNTTQSISDIQVLLQYVEGLLEKQNQDGSTDKLSDIGQNTLDIIDSIGSLTTALTEISDDVLNKHSEIIEENSVLTKESLEELIGSIENNELVQKQIHDEIKDIYTKYDESVTEMISQMEQNKENQEELTNKINEQITDINSNVSHINEKVLSKNDMTSIMSDIGEKLEKIIEADAEINANSQKEMESMNENLEVTREIMEGTSEELQTIKEMYTESTSRLSVIDTKMDAMTKHITEEEE